MIDINGIKKILNSYAPFDAKIKKTPKLVSGIVIESKMLIACARRIAPRTLYMAKAQTKKHKIPSVQSNAPA